ncbi:hypothetical protein E3N88_39068 [Mikania micrantha]|uniref:Uncharacterized protein n=1 Tax=Mikania micrantha TaxID=192012 RepID=A0A5N6LVY8_9ASTR|nr:hypothetical protein E3N88_39068 [Mikania micrantha]
MGCMANRWHELFVWEIGEPLPWAAVVAFVASSVALGSSMASIARQRSNPDRRSTTEEVLCEPERRKRKETTCVITVKVVLCELSKEKKAICDRGRVLCEPYKILRESSERRKKNDRSV